MNDPKGSGGTLQWPVPTAVGHQRPTGEAGSQANAASRVSL